jgi:hypothetical protein
MILSRNIKVGNKYAGLFLKKCRKHYVPGILKFISTLQLPVKFF